MTKVSGMEQCSGVDTLGPRRDWTWSVSELLEQKEVARAGRAITRINSKVLEDGSIERDQGSFPVHVPTMETSGSGRAEGDQVLALLSSDAELHLQHMRRVPSRGARNDGWQLAW